MYCTQYVLYTVCTVCSTLNQNPWAVPFLNQIARILKWRRLWWFSECAEINMVFKEVICFLKSRTLVLFYMVFKIHLSSESSLFDPLINCQIDFLEIFLFFRKKCLSLLLAARFSWEIFLRQVYNCVFITFTDRNGTFNNNIPVIYILFYLSVYRALLE